MPDTRRELAALQTLHADNVVGAVGNDDVRDAIETAHPSKVIQSLAYASRPVTGQVTGDIFLPTDSLYTQRWNGSSWDSWYAGIRVTPPSSVGLGWINQGDATLDTSGGSERITAGRTVAPSKRIRRKAAPATPWKVRLGVLPTFPRYGDSTVGLTFRDSVSGKLSAIEFRADSGHLNCGCVDYSTPTTYAANPTTFLVANHALSGPCLWLEIGDDGTNRTYGYSADGRQFFLIRTVARTDFLTADDVGHHLDSGNTEAAHNMAAQFIDWTVS